MYKTRAVTVEWRLRHSTFTIDCNDCMKAVIVISAMYLMSMAEYTYVITDMTTRLIIVRWLLK